MQSSFQSVGKELVLASPTSLANTLLSQPRTCSNHWKKQSGFGERFNMKNLILMIGLDIHGHQDKKKNHYSDTKLIILVHSKSKNPTILKHISFSCRTQVERNMTF